MMRYCTGRNIRKGGSRSGGDNIGNRAVITTQKNFEAWEGIGVYVHWEGSEYEVASFLFYCRLRGFRSPDQEQDYGYARLCQVIANYVGGDGLGVGVDEIKYLNIHNYDNGVYLTKDWDVVGRRFVIEPKRCYPDIEMLLAIDDSQPKKQQLG